MTSVQSFDESLQADPAQRIPAAADGSRGLTVIYSLTIFLSAFLLFQVQPLIGKFILPWFGGMPSVWTTCMLFFQLLLFGGYAYAHLTTSHLRPRWQAIVHGVLLAAACVALPIIPGDTFKPTGSEEPISRIILVLGATVGAPFFVLSSTGPLLQGWFSRTHHSRSPYRLYALSNVGSLLALITFPTLFEWLLPGRFLAWMWSIGFIVFAVLCGFCAWAAAVRGRDLPEVVPDAATTAEARPGWGTWLLWFALAMVPSVLLLATTNQVCLDVATVPFLWVLPLTLYLMSFILCFDSDRWYSRRYFIPGGAGRDGLCLLRPRSRGERVVRSAAGGLFHWIVSLRDGLPWRTGAAQAPRAVSDLVLPGDCRRRSGGRNLRRHHRPLHVPRLLRAAHRNLCVRS